ncbi:hypothetical protein EJB05_30476 [Eragrostis curvula]|uniref:Uncharacterized protein n=1 Tax=Eragrostis curvula TaxID=38414 RepID=A0A5J9UB30_9POAL|nr:hypothetical protein EJB05_30476 [Eragrostis curvula]
MVVAVPPSPRPPQLHFQRPRHPSPSPYPYATTVACSTFLPVVPRPAPIVFSCFRVSRPPRRAAMSAADSAAAADSVIGASSDAEAGSLAPDSVGENDLLIVGPGVLGRIVADMWKQVAPDYN